jgi:hypothetical protein
MKAALVMYGTAIGVLWISTLALAPAGYRFSWWRPVAAALLMTAAGKILRIVLSPFLGDWFALLLFPAQILIVSAVLLLPFWRSILVAGIYVGVVAGVYSVLFAKPAT